uniref:Rne/Rng family ribonuclease n=1 Tax=Acidobacterium capsulatum TaxID=33075 RepID=A0A7V4XSY4_9BACT
MAKEICISSTPHETRLAILEDDQLAEIYYERENEYTLAGSIYKGRVTRVLPGMQSAFVDIGLERDAFLYVTDFLEEQEDSDEYERVSTGPRPQAQQRAQSGQSQPAASHSQSQSQSPAPRAEAAPGGETESGDGEDARGARRWRGRRGRRRGVRGRGPQEETSESTGLEAAPGEVEAVEFSAAAEPAVYREHHEAAAHHRAPAETEAPAHTPFVLPGESLSRYGGKPAGSESSAEPAASARPKAEVFAKPSTLVEAPITNWDGGFVLPGESISRRRKGAARESAMESAPAPVESLPEIAPEPEVIAAPAAEAVSEVPAPAEITAVAEAPEAQAAVEAIEEATEADAVHEIADIAAAAATPIEEHLEVVEEVQEFEPEEGSASHRVDPSAPSEFRISPPEDFHEEAETEAEAETEEVTEEVTVAAASEPAPEVSHEEADAIADATHEAAEAASAPGETDIYGLAAGAGVFEEEEIDEDEYDFELLHDPAFEEHEADDLEEETLDQGAYLGEVVRDAHLEERLGVSDGEEEDAAEEEDDEDEQGFAEVSEDFDEDAAESEEESGEPRAAAPARREGRKFDRRRGRQGGGRQRHGGGGGGHRRASVQTMDLPIISDLLKQGQEILVQIAKEPIAKKGARITSHIALPGRFLVFMPTVNHVGVSRKISSDEERQRLKRILISEKGDATGGFIVRTAAEGAGEDELRADIRFLINLWNEIKERSDSGKAPALIYHDLNLVERILRDQVSEEFSTIWVDSETDYERIVRFLNRFQPSLVRRVKLYTKETPLFEQFGIQDEITKALKSKVWLKSGGSIVINQTEALVAIDINTGKYVGKTARLEDTIVKTNLDAIPEIVRQIRLRDLGGIIVIDFIDMDERKNRHKVLQALEEELKHDRAPSKVLQFNDFGLVAITRKRVKQSLERTLSIPCPVCTGTGMVKSPATVANEIYVEMRKMQRHFEGKDVLLRVNPEVVKTLKASGGRWLNELEEMTGKTIIVKSDPTLHPEQFDIH